MLYHSRDEEEDGEWESPLIRESPVAVRAYMCVFHLQV